MTKEELIKEIKLVQSELDGTKHQSIPSVIQDRLNYLYTRLGILAFREIED